MSVSLGARILEAALFAAEDPLDRAELEAHLPEGVVFDEALAELRSLYDGRGVRLERSGTAWAFRTDPELAPFLERHRTRSRRLSQAAMETLAIVAYHQPVTRAEIEECRGVAVAKGTFDQMIEAGWIRPCGRREAPGRPVLWATTDGFLDAFGLERLEDLPKRDEVERLGLFEAPASEAEDRA